MGKVDSGPDDADYEWFTRSLCDLESEHPGWQVTFPERYRGQNGHYVDGARFMTVERPDGRATTMEFIYKRLPWKFARSVGARYEERQRKGQLSVEPDASQVKDRKGPGRGHGQRQGKGRSRRNPKVA